jgi:hypothetical protein
MLFSIDDDINLPDFLNAYNRSNSIYRMSDMNITFESKTSNDHLATTEQKFDIDAEGKISGFIFSVKINALIPTKRQNRNKLTLAQS